jgi:hypothetical protein
MRERLQPLEQRNEEDKAKLAWLRAAAREGFDALELGDSVSLRSKEEIKDFLREIRGEVSARPGSRRKRG